MIIDSHAHLTCGDFSEEELPQILQRARDSGVEVIMTICTDPKSLEMALSLQKQHPNLWISAATTPHDVLEEGEVAFPIFAKAAQEGRLQAIGETGLDYYYEHSPKEIQKDFLKRYLRFASCLRCFSSRDYSLSRSVCRLFYSHR
jgi:TatD DNase family protein